VPSDTFILLQLARNLLEGRSDRCWKCELEFRCEVRSRAKALENIMRMEASEKGHRIKIIQ
jgi:MoaA/NifB/PqqE/SkfB family radical SAM enzyme